MSFNNFRKTYDISKKSFHKIRSIIFASIGLLFLLLSILTTDSSETKKDSTNIGKESTEGSASTEKLTTESVTSEEKTTEEPITEEPTTEEPTTEEPTTDSNSNLEKKIKRLTEDYINDAEFDEMNYYSDSLGSDFILDVKTDDISNPEQVKTILAQMINVPIEANVDFDTIQLNVKDEDDIYVGKVKFDKRVIERYHELGGASFIDDFEDIMIVEPTYE